ncbi:MAG: hypothetical protein JWP27_2697 [Flaviaesturariibacter sp.]|nr:hypothetical protein [Flaviaesturariibacter sp.]
MDNDIHVVEQDPLQGASAFVVIGVLTALFVHGILDRIGDCPDLGCVCGFADDKEFGDSLADLSQIERYDVLTLFLLDGLYYGLENF